MIYFFSWEFLAVGNFCRLGIFVGIFFVARKFLAEVFGGFWDFWRLGVFGVFGVFVKNGQNGQKWSKL